MQVAGVNSIFLDSLPDSYLLRNVNPLLIVISSEPYFSIGTVTVLYFVVGTRSVTTPVHRMQLNKNETTLNSYFHMKLPPSRDKVSFYSE